MPMVSARRAPAHEPRRTGGFATDGTFVAATFGLLDTLAPLAFLLLGDPTRVQALAIFVKACLFLLASQTLRPTRFLLALVAVLVLLTLTGLIADFYTGRPLAASVLRYVAFTISIFITLSVLTAHNFLIYCRFATIVPVAVALVHLAGIAIGAVSYTGGRFEYVRGLHPNLGGEIAAAAALTACMSLRPLYALPVIAIALAETTLMSSRASMIVVLLVAAVFVIRMAQRQETVAALSIYLLCLVAMALAAITRIDQITDFLGSLLLVDDSHRGAGTRLVGRQDLWDHALDQFRASPLIGQGLSAYDDPAALGAHNAFLYGLAQNGLLSLLFWLLVAVGYVRTFRTSPAHGFMLAAFLIMFMFNDRFLNLNSFPFLVYVALFTFASLAERR